MTYSCYRDYRDVQLLAGADLSRIAREILSRGCSFRFRANGWSMSPFLRDGDILTISPLPERIGLGEIVLFVKAAPDWQDQAAVVHRVVGRVSLQKFLIRGDNIRSATDGIISRENIVGRVERAERFGRDIRFGLGWERTVVAVLSRTGVLQPLVSMLRYVLFWRRRLLL